jgi:microcystin-dependent protein
MENKQKILLIIVIIVLTIVILYKFGKPKERFQSTNFDLNEVYLKGVQGSSGVKGNNGPKGDAGPACKNIVDFLENRGHLSLGEFSKEINTNSQLELKGKPLNKEINTNFQLELKGKPLNPNINFAKLKITDYEDQTCYPIMVGENESDAKFYLKNKSNRLKLFLQGNMEVEGEIKIINKLGKSNTITHSDLAPVGIIAAFGKGDIPESWAVCNGQLMNNGFQTPDLQNKFIKGANVSNINTTNERDFDEEFRFKNGDIKLKVENMPEHNHDYKCGSPTKDTMESGKDHTHDFAIYGGNTPLPPGVEIPDNHRTFLLSESSGDTTNLKTSDANDAHTHSYNTSNVNPITIEPVGGSKPFNIMPPYYTLLYIIKYK